MGSSEKKDTQRIWRIAKRLILAAVGLGVLGGASLVGMLIYYSSGLPTLDSLADYAPPQTTKIYSDDGHLVGRIFEERRTVVSVKEIPKHVIHAFLSAEDANFYEHEGLDYLGIMRAAIKNLRPGAHLQGASTITQQTVKTMVLGPERSYARKMREALLSWKLESEFSKDDILHLYLNQIYFGSGAYGVEEASQTYFGKSVRDVDLGEAAYLASIPKHPNRYTVRHDPPAAKSRQKYVLDRMVVNQWATAEAAKAELEEPIPAPAPPPPYLGKAPHFVEHIHGLLAEELGEDQLQKGGLTVYGTLHAPSQEAAHDALRRGLQELGRRHGFPGAPLRVEVDKLQRFQEELAKSYAKHLEKLEVYGGGRKKRTPLLWDLSAIGPKTLNDADLVSSAIGFEPLRDFTRVTGIVRGVDSAGKAARVDLGCCIGTISLESMKWARPFSPKGYTKPPRDPSQVLNPGDLVLVELGELPSPLPKEKKRPIFPVQLVPVPKADGALVSIDPHSRYVRAMVGGYEMTMGKLNRATQAKRQPGSSFKPIVYATGINERTITPAATCADAPVVVRDPWTGKQWKPQNYVDGKFDGLITYRTALMRSKNTCSVKLAEQVTPEKIIEMAHALGIKSDLPENLTIALGTGDITPMELANAYATIASGGSYAEPIFVRKVTDNAGNVLLEKRAELTEVLDASVAYVVSHMMRSVVESGTATKALVLDRPLAGKTGTSNESRNVWFSGFSAELVATVYIGFDDNKPLGRATGGGTALPVWIRYMGRALEGVPIREFAPPEDVTTVKVDPSTGELSDGLAAIEEVFIAGTEPEKKSNPLPSIFDVDEDLLDGGTAIP